MSENYPTHLVSLWMDNDQGIYYAVRDIANSMAIDADMEEIDRADKRDDLAAALESYFEQLAGEMVPGLVDAGSFVGDLWQASFGQVDWDALASELLAEDLESA